MKNLKIFAPREILIRLTDDGFVSTVRYAGLYARSTAWPTGAVEEEGSVVFVRPLIRRDRDEPCGYGEKNMERDA